MKIQDFFKGINQTFSPADERELKSLDDETRKWFNTPEDQPEWFRNTIGKYQEQWWFRQILMFLYLFTIPYLNKLIHSESETENPKDKDLF